MVCVIRCLFFVMDGTGLIVGRNAFQFQYNLSTTWSCLSSVLLSQPIQIQTVYKTIWLRIFLSSPASSVPILRSSDYFPLFSGSVIFSYLIVSLCSLTGKCVARKESHALPLPLGQVSWGIVASRAVLWDIVAPSQYGIVCCQNKLHAPVIYFCRISSRNVKPEPDSSTKVHWFRFKFKFASRK